MISSRTVFAAAALAMASATAGAESAPASIHVDGDCRTVRIRPDGSRVVMPARNPGRRGEGGSATVTAQSGGSVSVSSSSSSGSGRSVSTSTVNGVTVTVTRDETGCTAVIDERVNKRSSR